MESGYTLSDMAAATSGNGFSGDGLWIFALLLLLFGSNGNGFFGRNGAGDYGQFATAASQQDILFSSKFEALDNKIDRIGNGIADATFSLNNSIHNSQDVLGAAVVNEGRNLQQQLSDCCCNNVAMNAETKAAIHAEGAATRAMIQQNKIESLQAQVNELKTQNMFCGVPKINPYAYGVMNTAPSYSYCGCNGNI